MAAGMVGPSPIENQLVELDERIKNYVFEQTRCTVSKPRSKNIVVTGPLSTLPGATYLVRDFLQGSKFLPRDWAAQKDTAERRGEGLPRGCVAQTDTAERRGEGRRLSSSLIMPVAFLCWPPFRHIIGVPDCRS